jgi:hypothetical protein
MGLMNKTDIMPVGPPLRQQHHKLRQLIID